MTKMKMTTKASTTEEGVSGVAPPRGRGPRGYPPSYPEGIILSTGVFSPLTAQRVTAHILGCMTCTPQEHHLLKKGLTDVGTKSYLSNLWAEMLQTTHIKRGFLHLPLLQSRSCQQVRDGGPTGGLFTPTPLRACPPKTRPGWSLPDTTPPQEEEDGSPSECDGEVDTSGVGDVEQSRGSLPGLWGTWVGEPQGYPLQERHDRPGQIWTEGGWVVLPPMWGELPEIPTTYDQVLRGQTWA